MCPKRVYDLAVAATDDRRTESGIEVKPVYSVGDAGDVLEVDARAARELAEAGEEADGDAHSRECARSGSTIWAWPLPMIGAPSPGST